MNNAERLKFAQGEINQHFFSNAQFSNILIDAVQRTKEEMKGACKSIMAQLLVFSVPDENNQQEISLVAFADMPEDKQPLFEGIGMKMAQELNFTPVAIIFISEAWMKRVERKDKKRFYGEYHQGDLSKDPERKEIVIITGSTVDFRDNMAAIEIKRLKSGKIRPGKTTFIDYDPLEDGNKVVEGNLLRAFWRGYGKIKFPQ